MKRFFPFGLFALLFMVLACRPVIAIGWEEILLVLGLVIFLLGPPLYRFMRRIDDFRRGSRTKKG
jgi:hypothetical protein